MEKKEVTGNLKAVTPNKTGSTIRSTETNGLSVDENGNLVGTPTGLTWSSDPTAENYERQTVYIPVKVTNGEETYETNVPVLVYRDTDGDGKVDLDEGIKDPTTGEVIVEGDDDDDGDGYKDTVEKEAGTDPKDADSVPGSVIVPVGKVTVTPENSTITVDAPEGSGLTYDEATGKITGTPTVDDWGAEEETRVIKVPVTVETEGGATVTKTVEVTVYRDTDKDGKVDLDEGIKDPTTGEVIVGGDDDDDGDKITDTVEKEKGSDPKNPNSKPQTPIIVPGVVTITPGTQDVIEGEEITPVVIKTPEKSTVTVDTSKAPGLSYDEATGEITGTPEVNDWDDSQAPAYEEVRLIKTPLTVVDENGVTINKQIEITVQRDTDGDGNPDITDTDDDGDGFNDDLEKQMGTNPKDKDSKPTYTQVTDPSLPEKTEVANKDSLTDAEKTTVKEKLENANSFPEGTKVAIGNDGSATITYPDGSVDTIPGADLVVDKKPSPRPPRPSNPTPRPPVEEPQEPEKPKKKVDRINGDDRIGTSIELSQKYFDKAEIVVIARSDVYPDSLTASVLAKVLDAPIILTPSDQLDQRVAQELNRLETKMVYIVGGQTSITEGVQEDLVEITGSYKRIGGLDRFETSAMVAREIVAKEGEKGIGIIASGESFPDALSISPYAAKEGYPILLVRKDSIPSVISQAITDLGIEQTYVIGGENTISKNVENSLPGVLARIAGENRYATSVKVAEKFFEGIDHTAFIASGQVFADALVLGPVAAGEDAPILLVNRDNIPSEVDSYFKGHSFDKLTIVGGTNTISTGVENTLEEY